MHISEGVLPASVLLGGAALTAAGTALGLRRIDWDRVMTVALLAAAFFVASLIHVPVGPVSAHLVLNGLIGVILGWAAFPAILVALLLQALLFQFGGLLVLGVNTFNMALPPVICHYLFRKALTGTSTPRTGAAFACGFLSVLLTASLTALSLGLAGEGFIPAAQSLLIAHLPVMVVEGCITALVIGFLYKVRPEVLDFSAQATR